MNKAAFCRTPAIHFNGKIILNVLSGFIHVGRRRLIIFCFVGLFISGARAQNVLTRSIVPSRVERIVDDVEEWRAETKSEWLTAMANLPEEYRVRFVQVAEEANAFTWPSLLATTYLEFKVDGTRANYERAVEERRKKLSQLVLGELIEGQGRFLPQIVNGLWLTLEESTWVAPAHILSQRVGVGLPDPHDRYIDLIAARTSIDLAIIHFLFKGQLNEVSPLLSVRLIKELEDRVMVPYIEDDYWWMSFSSDFINNWNIWINTNVLKTALLIEYDKGRLRKMLDKLIRSADRFIDSYPEDGAIDEGATYWGHAGGELGQFIGWVHSASDGAVTFADEPKLFRIGEYILNARVKDNLFVNFADAHPRYTPSPAKIWTYGEQFDDARMKSFAAELFNANKSMFNTNSLHGFLMYLPIIDDLQGYGDAEANVASTFYESLGLAIIRSPKAEGFTFAAIGSHNGVSHNHNDVGSCILYYDGTPILIDVGVATYTKATFSSQRYTLWHTQSQWHNVPLINGVQQRNGKKYAAQQVHYTDDGKRNTFALDIAKAYPDEAQVRKWVRRFDLDLENDVIKVYEDYELVSWKDQSTLMYISKIKPHLQGSAVFFPIGNDKRVKLGFDPRQLNVSIEEKVIDDERLQSQWGDVIYRLKLNILGQRKKRTITYTLEII